jgi:hypothetical protein
MSCPEGTRSWEAAAPATVRQAGQWAAGAEASSEESASPIAGQSPLAYTEVVPDALHLTHIALLHLALAGGHKVSARTPRLSVPRLP